MREHPDGRRMRGSARTNRRSFLGVLLGIGTAFVGVLLSVPLIRFTLHPLLEKTTETKWSDIGPAKEFEGIDAPAQRLVVVEQRDGWRSVISEKVVYVVRENSNLRVLSPVCPHLGCFTSWKNAQQRFVCPCHVGIFARDGSLVSGPPPRGMDELESKIEEGILKTRYQYFRLLISTREALA